MGQGEGGSSMEWVHPGRRDFQGSRKLEFSGRKGKHRVLAIELRGGRYSLPPGGLWFPIRTHPERVDKKVLSGGFSEARLCLGCAPAWSALSPQI